MRLFACAVARSVWDSIPAGACQDAVAACEEWADGRGDERQVARLLGEWDQVLEHHWYQLRKLRAAIGGNHWGKHAALLHQAASDVREVEVNTLRDAGASPEVCAESDQTLQATHLMRFRDLFGNPFHPVAFDSAWRTDSVVSLAQTIYDDRQMPAGLFDNARLGVLADALEDAGCASADLLGHLRDGGEHVRGCWAVDLILGKT